MPRPWEALRRREIAKARVFTVQEVRTRAPHTGDEHDFYVIEAGDWCNVIAVTEAQELVCVRQYRHGVARVTLEIPGGIIDPGETPEAAAARELVEETGFVAERVTYLGAIDSNPAILSNRIHTCAAHGVRPGPAQQLDPHRGHRGRARADGRRARARARRRLHPRARGGGAVPVRGRAPGARGLKSFRRSSWPSLARVMLCAHLSPGSSASVEPVTWVTLYVGIGRSFHRVA